MMKHFLIRYNRRSGERDVKRFTGEGAGARAMQARFDLEKSAKADEEIVVIEAKNERAVRRTHSRYFRSVGELFADAV